jgi:hypothetical protein
MSVKEIQIRPLKVADRKRLSGIIKKFVETTGDTSFLDVISSAVSAAPGKPTDEKAASIDAAIQIGVKVIQSLLTTLEEETHTWFADLIGVTYDEFLELPVDAELVIVEQLVQAQEASSFFTIASRLYNKIELLRGMFSGAKSK